MCQEGQKVPLSEPPLGLWAAWAELLKRALELFGIQTVLRDVTLPKVALHIGKINK